MQYVRQRRLPSLRLCSLGLGGPRFLWRLEPIPLRKLDLSRTNGDVGLAEAACRLCSFGDDNGDRGDSDADGKGQTDSGRDGWLHRIGMI